MKMTPTTPNTLQPVPLGTVPSAAATPGGVIPPTNMKDPYNYVESLLERAYDGHEGYAKAAELTDSDDLKQFFTENSEQRARFALELEGVLRSARREVADSGTLAGKVHQGWMALVSKFSSGEEGLLNECQRGEETALKDYEEALESLDLPSNIAGIIERQRDRIRTELVVVGNLKELEAVSD